MEVPDEQLAGGVVPVTYRTSYCWMPLASVAAAQVSVFCWFPGAIWRAPSVGAVVSTVRVTAVPVPTVPARLVARTLMFRAPLRPVGDPVQVQVGLVPDSAPATQVV